MKRDDWNQWTKWTGRAIEKHSPGKTRDALTGLHRMIRELKEEVGYPREETETDRYFREHIDD